jgi:hypothetical protein
MRTMVPRGKAITKIEGPQRIEKFLVRYYMIQKEA